MNLSSRVLRMRVPGMHLDSSRRLACAALLLATVAGQAAAQAWSQRSPIASPPARSLSAMAGDYGRSVAVLFGGLNSTNQLLADTWEWNGFFWTQRLPFAAPSARKGHAMAHDSRRYRTVLFGGYRPDTGPLGDTWEWDGAIWISRGTELGPTPRWRHGMAFDRQRNAVVMFGGESANSGLLQDTWEWNGTSWQSRSPLASPEARKSHVMAYDINRSRTVLFGGETASGLSSSTWTYDGATWVQSTTAGGPSARTSATLAADEFCGQLTLQGGQDAAGAALSDVWAWDGSEWSARTGSAPTARRESTSCFDLARSKVVLFGGLDATQGALGDTWETTGGCSRAMETVAGPRIGGAATFRYAYPAAAAGHACLHLVTTRLAGSFPIAIPGFQSSGRARVDLNSILLETVQGLDASGANSMSFQVPNNHVFLGLQLDIQSLDIDLNNQAIYWASNDSEVAVGDFLPPASLSMAAIAAGSFSMGSTATAGAPYFPQPEEAPAHPVTISRSFWIGETEVTQAQFQAVMGSNPSFFQGASYPSSGTRPVENVTWSQAMAYCAALNAQEAAAGRVPFGYQYRLPTEAEWEYACRAGTTTEFYTGATLDCSSANISVCIGSTESVGAYSQNAFGLRDMHGNVREWCLDSWDRSADYPSTGVTNPYRTTGSYRFVRGGSWTDFSQDSRSARRTSELPTFASSNIGFRIVLAPALVP